MDGVSSFAVTCEKFRENIVRYDLLYIYIGIDFTKFFHQSKAQYGKTRNSVKPKKFRQINSSVISLVKRNFHEIFAKNVRLNRNNFHTVRL